MAQFEDMISDILNDPEQMSKIMDIASNIMGGTGSNEKASINTNVNDESYISNSETQNSKDLSLLTSILGDSTKTIGQITNAMSVLNKPKDREKTVLLESMMPWLSEKRKGKLMNAMKLARVMRVAGIIFLKNGGQK